LASRLDLVAKAPSLGRHSLLCGYLRLNVVNHQRFRPAPFETFPEAVTFWPAKGSSLLFCSVEGVSPEIGQ